MTTQPGQEPGSEQAAEAPTEPGYGNDTGFALEAEEADQRTGPGSAVDTPERADDADGVGEGADAG
ncbi:hypothetical protein GCM10027586_18100 [Kineococcus gypseus]|uniref:hypothetical protein n=1 Tax=Kineococcus gypseus TaxID=1637102 RepID=UPI003D7EADD3